MNSTLHMVLAIDIAAFHKFTYWEQELRFSGGSSTPATSSFAFGSWVLALAHSCLAMRFPGLRGAYSHACVDVPYQRPCSPHILVARYSYTMSLVNAGTSLNVLFISDSPTTNSTIQLLDITTYGERYRWSKEAAYWRANAVTLCFSVASRESFRHPSGLSPTFFKISIVLSL